MMSHTDSVLTAKPFLTARWVHLVMLNYEIDAAVLSPFVPAGVELDAWDGRMLVSMVGFQFLDTRVRGIPIPFHRHFDEVNLRFYVRREQDGELRRGVVFVKEIVPRRAIAWVARTIYNENYVALAMAHDDGIGKDGGLEYRWKLDGAWHRLGATVVGEPTLPAAGSEGEFITEHYWGYAAQRDGSTVEYRVEHPQWRVWQAVQPVFDSDVAALYGPRFVPALSADPVSCFVAEGSEVTVRRGGHLADG